MVTMEVSPKIQDVVPKEIRQSLSLEPGEDLQIYIIEKPIRVPRTCPIKELAGIVPGLVWKDEDRDHSERL